ncbi:hypothetical protein CC86DRAFT_368720 [Ophiobolus disseminans]|uniref:Uncharacterized protein n=1 Tax=Ophiobolus disseminans TaxID=1469910 RepID=A0A6A7A6S4_9PLEO|nr:hypothetical protein CC86DRAFT_368720 [Ophiobolus disseminans]
MTSCVRNLKSTRSAILPSFCTAQRTNRSHYLTNRNNVTSSTFDKQFSKMSWMDSWSRPSKNAATPPPLYLTIGDSVPYCHTCGRVIGDRKKHGSEVKYCSSRCRNSKPGPTDRAIEAAFAALLNGASPESLKAAQEQDVEQGKAPAEGKYDKKHKKKGSKSMKGDQRLTIDCQTVEEVVFQREKDPEKVYGRRKNRKARFVVEKPEDWRSVDMVDHPTPSTTGESPQPKAPTSLTSEDDNNDTVSEADSIEHEGGIVLEDAKAPNTNPDDLPDTIEYGYGSGKVRPPQDQNDVNGSVGGEKGWAERTEETEDQKAKRFEGQRRAIEREMIRKAARRGCAFGFAVEGEEDKKKCEAVMKGTVVEASFAKGEWGVRWREKV